jgi:hypothetical protein
MPRQYQQPRVRPPIEGLKQSFIFPLVTNPPRAARGPQQPRVEVPPIGGATSQETSIFAVNQPRNYRTYQVRPTFRVRSGATPSISAKSIFTAPIAQPDRARQILQAYQQSRQDVTPIVHQGSLVDTTLVDWRLVTTPAGYVPTRQQIIQTLPFTGAPAAPGDTDIFRADPQMPPNRYWFRPAPVIVRRQIRGVTTPIPVPFPLPAGPSSAWWTQGEFLSRRVVTPVQFSGATERPTYVFAVSQPEPLRWHLRRLSAYVAPGPRVDGVEPQALYLFPLSQPQGWSVERLVSRFVVTPQLLGAFTPPPVAQTYLFPPGQPSRSQWYVPRTPSEQVPAPVQLAGAISVATFPIPTVGNSEHTYWPWRWQVQETATKSYSALVWSEIIVIPPAALSAADACDTFVVGADKGAFLIGADKGALMIGADRGSFVIGTDPGVFIIPGCD